MDWLLKLLGWRKPLRHYVFPVIRPEGGKLRDEHAWGRTYLDARKSVMDRYDLGALLIGPGQEIDGGA